VTDATPFAPDVEKWDPWRPEEAYRRLAQVEAPWYVAAGWAIDLFLGGRHREHEDLEIAVAQDRFDEVADALSGFEIFVVEDGLVKLLEHARDSLPATHQTWVREADTGLWRLDVFREPSAPDAGTWVCRRDESIRLPLEEVIIHTADGIPYGRPEIILLYKAKHSRPKDEADFAAVLPLLEPDRRHWLAEALDLVHPGHRWLAALADQRN